jgi:predicted ATPase
MSIRGCVLIAIEGTHAAGKTTLAHALTAHYRERGTLVECTPEPARTSPYIEETVIHGKGEFDLTCELDLFAAQLSATLRAARHQRLLICDKTIVNVLAYARLVLATTPETADSAVVEAMTALCRTWAPQTYDAVFYLSDGFHPAPDPMRARVGDLQAETAQAVRAACHDVGIPLVDVPGGLDTAARVAWIARRVDRLLANNDD